MHHSRGGYVVVATSPQHHRRHHSMAKVRFLHNVAGGPDVDIVVDGKSVLEDVAFGTISDYLKVPAGIHSIQVTPVGTNQPLQDLDISLGHQDYTAIVHGGPVGDALANGVKSASVGTLVLVDDSTCPARGKAHVRFVHAAAGAPAVDVLVDGNVAFGNVSYGNTGMPTYAPVPAGQHRLSVNVAGTNTEVLGFDGDLKNGQIYSVIASGVPGSDEYPLSAIVRNDKSTMCMNYHHY